MVPVSLSDASLFRRNILHCTFYLCPFYKACCTVLRFLRVLTNFHGSTLDDCSVMIVHFRFCIEKSSIPRTQFI